MQLTVFPDLWNTSAQIFEQKKIERRLRSYCSSGRDSVCTHNIRPGGHSASLLYLFFLKLLVFIKGIPKRS